MMPEPSRPTTKPPKVRTRSGSWTTFERRFQPIDGPDGATYWRGDQLPKGVDPHLVWTIVEGDRHLWLKPGFCFVNRIDYVLCFVPWTEDNPKQPRYRYH